MPAELLADATSNAVKALVRAAAIDAVPDVVAEGHAAIYAGDDAAAHDAIDALRCIIDAWLPAAGRAELQDGIPAAAANAAAAAEAAVRRAGNALPPDKSEGAIAEWASYHAKEATAKAIDAPAVGAVTAALAKAYLETRAAAAAIEAPLGNFAAITFGAVIDAMIAAAAADGYAAGHIAGYAAGYVPGYQKGYTDGDLDAEYGKGWDDEDDDIDRDRDEDSELDIC